MGKAIKGSQAHARPRLEIAEDVVFQDTEAMSLGETQ